MKKIIFFLILLTSESAISQIINGDFEDWETTFITSDCDSLSNNFGVLNPLAGVLAHWINPNGGGSGICQTTDSYSGNYALILHNWYGYAQGVINYNDSISRRPQYLEGYFKYNTGGQNGLTSGNAWISLTRFNGISNDTIAIGFFQFDSTAYYIPFQISFNYTSGLMPDSIHILMISGIQPCQENNVCHVLYIDSVFLSNSPLGAESLNSKNDYTLIQYDEFSNLLNIQNNLNKNLTFTLYNLTGEILIDKMFSGNSTIIRLSNFPNGFYFYMLTSDCKVKTGKLIKD